MLYYMKKKYQIFRVPEFRIWFYEQTVKVQVQINDRLSKIQDDGYFGDRKSVCAADEIWELR